MLSGVLQKDPLRWEMLLDSEAAVHRLAAFVAQHSEGKGVIWLSGHLGAGKTTFCRGLVRYFGHQGAVKSPTFTLVEPYELCDKKIRIYHFDLYRLSDPMELDYLGLDDYFDQQSLCLVEWPEKGGDYLPAADLHITIALPEEGSVDEKSLEKRKLCLTGCTEKGKMLVNAVIQAFGAK